MADQSLPRDPHAQARANIRETMKWMATGFGAVAAAIVGGTPLTGIGALAPDGRLWLAVGSGLFGLVMLGVGILVALSVLVTPPLFLKDIPKDAGLLKLINDRVSEFLPPNFADLASFIERRDRALENVRAKNDQAAKSLTFLENAGLWIDRLMSYAYFELLRRRLATATLWLFTVGFLAAVSFAVFAWAANPPKPDKPVAPSAQTPASK